jgi:hypothetical protein
LGSLAMLRLTRATIASFARRLLARCLALSRSGRRARGAQLYEAYRDRIALEEIESYRQGRIGQIKRRVSAGDLDGALSRKAA